MVECEIHGLGPVTACCLHVWKSWKEGAACEMDYVFDEYGEAYLFCVSCVAVAREYARSHQHETIGLYPVELQPECRAHLREWSERVNHVRLNELLEEAAKRTQRQPEF